MANIIVSFYYWRLQQLGVFYLEMQTVMRSACAPGFQLQIQPAAGDRRQCYCWHQQRFIFLLCCCNTGLAVLPVQNELSRPGFQALALCEWPKVPRSSNWIWLMANGCRHSSFVTQGQRKSSQGRVCVCVCKRDADINFKVNGPNVWLQKTCKVT